MRLHPLKSSNCNRGILDHWPHPREPQAKPYPLAYPSHPRLVARLCPMQTKLTSRDHDGLTWAQVKGWL